MVKTELHYASINGNAAAVERLIKWTDLHSASYLGDAAKVERLLKQHPEWVHEKDPVRSARVG